MKNHLLRRILIGSLCAAALFGAWRLYAGLKPQTSKSTKALETELVSPVISEAKTSVENPIETYVFLANGFFANLETEENKTALEDIELAYRMARERVNKEHITLLVYNPFNWALGINPKEIDGKATLENVVAGLKKLTPDGNDRTSIILSTGSRELQFAGEELPSKLFNEIIYFLKGQKIIIQTNRTAYISSAITPRALNDTVFIGFPYSSFRDFDRIWNQNPELSLGELLKRTKESYGNDVGNSYSPKIFGSEGPWLNEPLFPQSKVSPPASPLLSSS